MTTTEDNKDQEALAIMSERIRGRYGLFGSLRGTAIELTPEQITSILADGLSALAEAGYTVVKTPSGYEYGFAFDSDSPETVNDYGVFPTAKAALESAAPRSLGERDTYRAYRRRIAPIIEPFRWEPVPESDTQVWTAEQVAEIQRNKSEIAESLRGVFPESDTLGGGEQ